VSEITDTDELPRVEVITTIRNCVTNAGRRCARAARRIRPIESVVFARSHRRSRKCRRSLEVSFLELTPQTVRELDLGIAGEPGCRFEPGIAVGQLNLEHGGDHYAYPMPARKCPVKTGNTAPILRIERSTESAPCQHSRQRGTEAAVHDKDYDAVIREGQARNGMSALIDLVARKS
jgi:hypothetical protein